VKHKKSVAVAMGIALGLGLPVLDPGSPAHAVSCNSGLVYTGSPTVGGFAVNEVNIRTGPATYCAVRDVGYTWHNVTFYCWTSSDNHYDTWTYLRDNTTGVSGYSRDDLLRNSGSPYSCY
jgi:hypothetical protein